MNRPWMQNGNRPFDNDVFVKKYFTKLFQVYGFDTKGDTINDISIIGNI